MIYPAAVLKNKNEETEFGSVIRRSGTVCLPSAIEMEESRINEFAKFVSIKQGTLAT